MKNIRALPLTVACLISFGGVCAGAESAEDAVKDILLGSGYVGMPSHIEEARALQKRASIPDSRMQSTLQFFIRSGFQAEDGLTRELTGNAIGLLAFYGDGSSLAVLKPVMKGKNGNLRHRAIKTYMRLSDHQLISPVKDVFCDPTAYDDQDRRAGYEELVRAYGAAKKEDKTKKTDRLMLVIVSRMADEVHEANRVLLEKFLAKENRPQKKSSDESSTGSVAEPLPLMPTLAGSGSAESKPVSAPTEHTINTPPAEPTSSHAPSPAVRLQEEQAPPSSESSPWTHLVVGLAAGLATGAAGAWLLLRRRSGG